MSTFRTDDPETGYHVHYAELESENAKLKALLGEAVAWVNSKPVQDSFQRAAGLTLTHPHLGVKIDPEFALKAADMWKRIRESIK